jgi:hypothetical protein
VSNNIAEDKREAAKGISASVDRLETLFDRLYSDTLGMMRETVKDMRKHIWPVDHTPEELVKSVDRKADEKVEQIRQQVSKELTEMVQRVGKAETKVDSIEVPIFNVQNLLTRYIPSPRHWNHDFFRWSSTLQYRLSRPLPAFHSSGNATHEDRRESLIACHIEPLDRRPHQLPGTIIRAIFVIP